MSRRYSILPTDVVSLPRSFRWPRKILSPIPLTLLTLLASILFLSYVNNTEFETTTLEAEFERAASQAIYSYDPPPPRPLPTIEDFLSHTSQHAYLPSSSGEATQDEAEAGMRAMVQWNEETMRRILSQHHQTRPIAPVVIVGSMDFIGMKWGNWTGGEAIWARSTLVAFESLKYHILYASTIEEITAQYQLLGDYVNIVIVGAETARSCWNTPTCIKQPPSSHAHTAPGELASSHVLVESTGVPSWKLFSWHFWPTDGNPLGFLWTLSPEPISFLHPYDNKRPWWAIWRKRKQIRIANTYLGYSIESWCKKEISPEKVQKKVQAFAFAKRSFFFHNDQYPWSVDIIKTAREKLGMNFVAACNLDSGLEVPEGIERLGGPMQQADFFKTIRESAILYGQGDPPLSPSPYDALCLGTPFLNPILRHNSRKPNDRSQWYVQQEGLRDINPPYVYHVVRGDKKGFLAAMQSALENPIESYILPHMTLEAVEARAKLLVEGTDWRRRAFGLLQYRKSEGESEDKMFVL